METKNLWSVPPFPGPIHGMTLARGTELCSEFQPLEGFGGLYSMCPAVL